MFMTRKKLLITLGDFKCTLSLNFTFGVENKSDFQTLIKIVYV